MIPLLLLLEHINSRWLYYYSVAMESRVIDYVATTLSHGISGALRELVTTAELYRRQSSMDCNISPYTSWSRLGGKTHMKQDGMIGERYQRRARRHEMTMSSWTISRTMYEGTLEPCQA